MAAQNGSMVAMGRSGRSYNIDVYMPDAAATLLTFNVAGAAAATSSGTWVVPEDIVIVDYNLATAPTAVGVVLRANDAPINGGILRYASQLTTAATRAPIRIPVKGGVLLSGLQI